MAPGFGLHSIVSAYEAAGASTWMCVRGGGATPPTPVAEVCCQVNIFPLSGKALVPCCWEDGFVEMREAGNSFVE